MRIMDFLERFLRRDDAGGKNVIYFTDRAGIENGFSISEFAILCAANYISRSASRCTFETFQNGVKTKKDEYYLWNVRPNVNQNAAEFKQELFSRLCIFGECLVIQYGNNLIIAEGFAREADPINGDSFTGVFRESVALPDTFRREDVMYFRYDNPKIRDSLQRVGRGYDEILRSAVKKYRKATAKKMIFRLNAAQGGKLADETSYDQILTDRVKPFLNATDDAAIGLRNGQSLEDTAKEQESKGLYSDVKSIIDDELRLAANAFNMPAQLLTGNVAGLKDIIDIFLSFCMEPIFEVVQAEINRQRIKKENYLKNSFIKIDRSCLKHIDIFNVAQAFDKLIACGGFSIDELRERCGYQPKNTRWSRRHWRTKNYESIDDMEIEEKDNKPKDGKEGIRDG